MDPHTDHLMEFLTNEGYRPTLRPDGDIAFKSDGGFFLIRLDPNDDQYFAIAFPNFWPLKDESEVVRALRAANRVTTRTKAAKVIVLEKRRDVWVTVEFFAHGTEQFEATFGRLLSGLRYAVQKFGEEMRASEPLADGRIALSRGQVTRFQHGN